MWYAFKARVRRDSSPGGVSACQIADGLEHRLYCSGRKPKDVRSPEYATMLDAHAFDTLTVRVLVAVATRDQSDKP